MTENPTSTSDEEGHAPPAEPPASFAYHPALDGVRAIAVLLVVGVHITDLVPWISIKGGWLGVDVFFVLSGYLITSLLLTERTRTGHNHIRDFYIRRFLRLAPLSITVVAVVWIGAHRPSQTGMVVSDFGAVSVLLYFSNWVFMGDISKLGSLFHCWSLSIEEQFYLVWPAVMIIMFRLGRKHARTLVIALLATVFIVQGVGRRYLWIRAFNRGHKPGLAWMYFYGSSIRRPDGLVLGCLLAVVLHGRRMTPTVRKIATILGSVGAVVAIAIVWAGDVSGTTTSHAELFIPRWGLSVFNLAVAAVVFLLVASPQSLPSRVLSVRPFNWVGRRAYGIYLIHPIMFRAVYIQLGWPKPLRAVVGIIGTIALVAASYRWLETPFLRRKARYSTNAPTT